MLKKQWAKIVIIALVFGTVGSVFCTRFLIPYLSTFKPFGFLRNLQTTTPIIINRREEIRLDDGVNIIDLVKQAEPPTVTVYAGRGKDLRLAGSGIILTADGVIMTSREAAGSGIDLSVVLNDGKFYPALLRALDPKSDLAVVTIDAKDLPVFQFGDAASASVGAKLYALGSSAREFTRRFAPGFVTNTVSNYVSLDQALSTEQISETVGTDADLAGNFSGGPVIDPQGKLLGIVSDRSGKIITSEAIQGALNSYLANGKIARPYWGIKYLALSKSLAELRGLPSAGALVVTTDDASPAGKAGLAAGDLIVKVNGSEVAGDVSFERLVNSKSGEITLGIIRSGQPAEIKFNVEKK